MNYPMRVRDHMTSAPYCLEASASLANAARCLSEWGVERAPVCDDEGTLSGLVSTGELRFARQLAGSDHALRLKDIPLQDVYLTTPDAPLARVARALTLHKVECAVVREADKIVGLLPWADVVQALLDLTAADPSAEQREGPSDIRSLILLEHANVHRVLRRVERAARRILSTPFPQESDLEAAYDGAQSLCHVMATELELEDHVLAPALEALDAWGKVRADRLRAEHAEQALVLRSYLLALRRLSASDRAGHVLVSLVLQLVDGLRETLQLEEASVLRADVLCDELAASSVETG